VADVPFEVDRALADIRRTVESGRVGAALQDLRDLAARCGFQGLADRTARVLSRWRRHDEKRATSPGRGTAPWFRIYTRCALSLLSILKKEIVRAPGPIAIRDASAAPIAQSNDLLVKDLFKEHQRAFRLTGLSFALRRGQIAGIVGPNGSGKTTLLRILAGELACDGGDVTFAGAKPGSRQYLTNVAFVPQRPPRWSHDVRRHLSWHAALAGRRPKESERAVEDVLTWLQLRDHARKGFDQISEGQRMRVAIAAALLSRPKLLLLDEPLALLDPRTQLQFLRWLRGHTREWRELATVISSQHIPEIELVADEIIHLEDGCRIPQAKTGETGIIYEIASRDDDTGFERLTAKLRELRTTGVITEFVECERFAVVTYLATPMSFVEFASCLSDAAPRMLRDVSTSARAGMLSHVEPR
jgi:ABC-2 type transport system ATP-binding protein